jgi:hypothetical protein
MCGEVGVAGFPRLAVSWQSAFPLVAPGPV